MSLGKGLESLIPPKSSSMTVAAQTAASHFEHSRDQVLQLSVTAIDVNPYQPRHHFSHTALAELVESVRQHGILQPLLVSRIDDEHYELIAGERRLRAATAAGLETVPALVRDVADLEKLELALIENIQRSDLNPIERADSYRKLVNEFGINHDVAAKKIGISRSAFTNTLRLMDLPTEIQVGLAEEVISEGHAKVLLGLASAAQQLHYFQLTVQQKWSVRVLAAEVEGKTKQVHGHKAARRTANLPAQLRSFQEELMEQLGTKVTITPRGDSGDIKISYYSAEELSALVRRLTGKR